jgi:RecB family exonuclease
VRLATTLRQVQERNNALHDRAVTMLTQSSLKTFRACQRLYRLRYVEGWRTRETPEPLHFGTLLHAGLEAWWSHLGDDRLPAALDAIAHEQDPWLRARAEVMLLAYNERWRREDLEVLGVEVQFQAPLVNPHTGRQARTLVLGGKIDAVVRTPDGRVLIVEHKSTGEDPSPGSTYRLRLRMDPQISLYFDGAAALGWDAAGCLYDVLVKPRIRPGKTETPDQFRERLIDTISSAPDAYLQRFEVARLARDLDEAREDVWQVAALVRNSRREGVAPRNADSCIRYGRPCEFLPVCARETSLETDARFVRSAVEHPELERRSE